jgi:hypothetical protein
MADGYGAGLFDDSGPKDFATAIGGISTALTGVGTAFSTFGKTASDSLSGISKTVDSLISKLGQFQSQLANITAGAGAGGAGGAQNANNIPPPQQSGIQPGNQWAAGNGPSPNSQTGASTPQAGMPQDTASNAPGFWNKTFGWLTTGTAGAEGAQYGGTQPGGGGGGGSGMPQGTAGAGGSGGSTMGQRAAQSMIPAAIGAATNYAGGMMSTAVQGATIGQMYAPAFGVSSRSMYVIPNGILAQNPQDYAQSNYYAMQNLGLAPGTQNWSSIMGPGGGLNQLMTLDPGLTRQQAAQSFGNMMAPQTLNAGMMYGFNFSPMGKMETPQQQYQQVFQRLAQGVGGKPTGAQVEAWLRPGGPWSSNLASMGWQPGTAEYTGFVNYALTQVGMSSQGKSLIGSNINLGTTSGAQQTPLGNTPAYAQLQAQSAQSQVESQAEPDLAQAAKSLNEAATQLLHAVNPLASLFGSSGIGGLLKGIPGIGSMMGGSPLSMLGNIPGVGSMLKNIPGVGTMFGGSNVISGLVGKIPGVGSVAGSLLKHLGLQAGGLVPGTGNDDTVPAMLTPGEYVIPKNLVSQGQSQTGTPVSPGMQSSSSTVGQLMVSKLSDLQPTTVASILFNPPSAGTVLQQLAGAHGGQAKQTGAQTGGKSNAGQAAGITKQEASQLLSSSFSGSVPANVQSALASALGLSGTGGGAGGGGGGTGGASGSATGSAPTQPYTWTYKSGGLGPSDLSGMFMTTSSSGGSSKTTSSSSSGPTTLTGSGNVQQAYDYFLSKGLKDYMAAGIVGNLAQESGVNPTSTSPGALGIAQWTPPTALQAWAKQQNRSATDLSTHLDFLWMQMNSTEKGALVAVQASTDAASAAQAFEQQYERAGIPMMQNRVKYAQNVLSSKGANYARGTQLIARNQLAMLHTGEAVVPAADNYSSSPYNKNGASNGGSTSVQLNFKAGSVVLQVPPSSSQQDMENLANQFVAAISKPAVLAGVRST